MLFLFSQEILEVDIEDEKQLDDSPENFWGTWALRLDLEYTFVFLQ